ncbi:hypothetical protein Chor_014882 [Crotalus horridus]
MGRSFRGFGFGLTFFPLVAMLLFNLYSMFLLDTENMFAVRSPKAASSPLVKEEELTASRPWPCSLTPPRSKPVKASQLANLSSSLLGERPVPALHHWCLCLGQIV